MEAAEAADDVGEAGDVEVVAEVDGAAESAGEAALDALGA